MTTTSIFKRFLMAAAVVSISMSALWLQPAPVNAAPPDYGYTVPVPSPALPAGMDTFTPPLLGDRSGPAVAEFTRTGGPNDTITVAGPNFTKATQFRFYAQTKSGNAVTLELPVNSADDYATSLILPGQLPGWSMYLMWPRNSNTYGMPIAVNRTDAWWIGSDRALPGDTVSIFGRNLSHDNGKTISYVYVKPAGNALGRWVAPTAVNPYKVDFTVPSLAPATYEVWTHNGHGGQFGWSGPLMLNVTAASPYAGQSAHVFNVKTYGAVGDGSTDDTAAIEHALSAAGGAAPATIYFPAGTYLVDRSLTAPHDVSWLGDNRDTTTIMPAATFNSDHSNTPLISSGGGNGASSNVQFSNLTFAWNPNNPNRAQYSGLLFKVIGQDFIKITNSRLNWRGVVGGVTFNGNSYFEISNTELIGDGAFLGNGHQVRVVNDLFKLTDFASAAVTSWGGRYIDVSNCRAEDYDPDASSTADMGTGRFFTSQSHPDTNMDLYIGGNTTVNMAPAINLGDSNQGEQILFEEGSSLVALNPTSATSTTATFSSPLPTSTSSGPITSRDATIISGRGAGQTRHVSAVNGETITVSSPWSLIPDVTSVIGLGPSERHAVIYGNTLEGKANYATYQTASVGINMYGNTSDIVFANNTLTDMRGGLVSEYCQTPDPGTPTPSASFFNLVADNTLIGAYNGASFSTDYLTRNMPGLLGHLGNTYRRNRMTNIIHAAFAFTSANAGYTGGDMDFDAIEHNTVTNFPIALQLGPDQFNPGQPVNTKFSNLILYANTFDRGTAAQEGSKALDLLGATMSGWMSANTWIGFGPGTPNLAAKH